MCVCIGWIEEWLHFPESPNKTKAWCVCFGVLCVFTLLLNNTTSLITGIHIFRLGESPIDYPPKALQPEEGSHLGLPFMIVAPVENGNICGN